MAQGFAVFAGIAPDIIRASARDAEALGYSSFWVNHPGPTDGLAALAHAAGQTRAIELGIGVIPLHTRGPASIVDGVKTQALPGARLLLGVGSPNPRSLERVRDGVAALGAQLPGVRLVVAALGPKMSRLAGEVADGVLFNWLTPEHARVAAGWVREGAAAVNRQPPKLFAYVRVAIGTAAGDRVADEAARYDAIPAYNAHFVRMGVKPVDTCIAVQNAEDVAPALAKWRGVLDEIVVRAIVARDTVEDHLAVVRAATPR